MKNKDYTLPVIVSAVMTAVISAAAFFISLPSGVLCLVLGVAVTATELYFARRRRRSLETLNGYLALVCSGEYALDIADNTEGELSILKNNLYKVIALLSSTNEALMKEKHSLADSLADISHQLKTPLTSMMVAADLLEQEESAEKRKELTALISAQLERMRWLIATLLKLSKLDAKTAEFRHSRVDINEVIEEALRPFLLSMDVKNITVVRQGDGFTFTGDKNWSVEALQNIIKNCTEHMPDGGTLTVTTASTTMYDELIIRDSGGGISEADLPHIFERFYHGADAGEDSVGIGLALSKAILQNEKADIEAFNDGGAVFRIKFYKAVV